MQHEKSGGAVIFHEGKETEFLLLNYPSGHWDFAKGHVEKGEKEEEAAVREAKEETGLEIEIMPGFREAIKYFYKKDGELVSKEVVFFLAKAKKKEVKLSFEHKGCRWLAIKEALGLATYRNSQNVLKKADEFLKGRKSLTDF